MASLDDVTDRAESGNATADDVEFLLTQIIEGTDREGAVTRALDDIGEKQPELFASHRELFVEMAQHISWMYRSTVYAVGIDIASTNPVELGGLQSVLIEDIRKDTDNDATRLMVYKFLRASAEADVHIPRDVADAMIERVVEDEEKEVMIDAARKTVMSMLTLPDDPSKEELVKGLMGVTNLSEEKRKEAADRFVDDSLLSRLKNMF